MKICEKRLTEPNPRRNDSVCANSVVTAALGLWSITTVDDQDPLYNRYVPKSTYMWCFV